MIPGVGAFFRTIRAAPTQPTSQLDTTPDVCQHLKSNSLVGRRQEPDHDNGSGARYLRNRGCVAVQMRVRRSTVKCAPPKIWC